MEKVYRLHKNILSLIGFSMILFYLNYRFRNRKDFVFETDMSINSYLFFCFLFILLFFILIVSLEKLLKIEIIKKNGKILNLISPYYLKLRDLILKPLIAFENYLYGFNFVYKSATYLILMVIKYKDKKILKIIIFIFVFIPKIIIGYNFYNDFIILNTVSNLYNVLPLLLLNIFINIILYSLIDSCERGMNTYSTLCVITKEKVGSKINFIFELKNEYENYGYNLSRIVENYCDKYYPGYSTLSNIKYEYKEQTSIADLFYFPLIMFCLGTKLIEYNYILL